MPLIALFVGVSILLMKEKGVFRKEIKMTREEAIDIAISALHPGPPGAGGEGVEEEVDGE